MTDAVAVEPDQTTRAASVLVAALEHAWTAIRARHPEVPDAVMVVASGRGSSRQRLRLGHLAASRWEDTQGGRRHEVLVGAEGLQLGSREVLGTLLHEGTHALARARGVRDTSRGGRYHNRRFHALAGSLGLEVACPGWRGGWAATSLPAATAEDYAGVLEELEASLTLWRRDDAEVSSAREASRNLVACECGCGRRVRVSRTTLAEAPIVWGVRQAVRARGRS